MWRNSFQTIYSTTARLHKKMTALLLTRSSIQVSFVYATWKLYSMYSIIWINQTSNQHLSRVKGLQEKARHRPTSPWNVTLNVTHWQNILILTNGAAFERTALACTTHIKDNSACLHNIKLYWIMFVRGLDHCASLEKNRYLGSFDSLKKISFVCGWRGL